MPRGGIKLEFKTDRTMQKFVFKGKMETKIGPPCGVSGQPFSSYKTGIKN
jgi:hypothetical protein